MIVYAVREFIQYDSNDIIKLFSTQAKAKKFVAQMENDPDGLPFEYSIEKVEVE